jgi:hypothetical protein
MEKQASRSTWATNSTSAIAQITRERNPPALSYIDGAFTGKKQTGTGKTFLADLSKTQSIKFQAQKPDHHATIPLSARTNG